MELFYITLSITLAQIPAAVLRYLPFSQIVSNSVKKKLMISYTICFLLQHLFLYFYFTFTPISITPLSYKRLIFLLSLTYVSINFILIKGFIFQHLFVYGMQGGYSLLLHSVIAYFLGIHGMGLPFSTQLLIQTGAYMLLFILLTIPLWKKLKSSFIFKRSVNQDYYWNIIWLIPCLSVYSDAIVTMNSQWIHTWQQVVSRIMTGFAIYISWKCIDLDFKSLEEMLTLRNVNKLLHLQEESIHSQAKILEENDKKIRILKHDMRHHLNLLSTLIEHENYIEANSLISQLNDSLQSTKPILFCKNAVINSALLVYISMAQENKIEVVSEIDIPETIPWNSNDIGVLFSNILENALLASMKQEENQRKIYITTRYADKKLAILIKNRFDGAITFDKNGLPLSTQQNHGIGFISISSIVNKYRAQVSCTYKDGWFSISFLFSEQLIEESSRTILT